MLGLLVAFGFSTGFGLHAFYHHRCEGSKMVSARRWMYGLYAAAFLLVSIVNYSLFLITVLLGNSYRESLHLVYATLVLLVSYSVVLAGGRRKP